MFSVGQQPTVVLILLLALSLFTATETTDQKYSKAGSPKEQTTKSTMEMFAFINDMQAVDFLRTGAVLVLYMAILFWDRRAETWSKAELISLTAVGLLAYFAPASLLQAQLSGEHGVVHDFIVHAAGAMALGAAAVMYYSSNDAATRSLHTVTRLIFSVVIFMVHLYGHTKYNKDALHFNLQHATLVMFSMGMYAFGCAVQLFRQMTSSSGRSVASVVSNSCLNQHLMLDGFIVLLDGFLNFGFPDFTLSTVVGYKPEGIGATLLRHVGVFCIMSGLQSVFSCGLQNDSDKRAVLFGRLVFFATHLPVVFLFTWKHALIPMETLLIRLAFAVIPVGNVLCALYYQKDKQKQF